MKHGKSCNIPERRLLTFWEASSCASGAIEIRGNLKTLASLHQPETTVGELHVMSSITSIINCSQHRLTDC